MVTGAYIKCITFVDRMLHFLKWPPYNAQGDEIWLLVGSNIGFQTASMISLERILYKIKNKMHK